MAGGLNRKLGLLRCGSALDPATAECPLWVISGHTAKSAPCPSACGMGGADDQAAGRETARLERRPSRVVVERVPLSPEDHAAACSLANSALAAGRSSPSQADICARRCGSSQCGQLNLMISRGRSAKLVASRSNPVSTTSPVLGHRNFNAAITAPIGDAIRNTERGNDVARRLRNRVVRRSR